MSSFPPPQESPPKIVHIPSGQSLSQETLHLGPISIRILEDGRNTSNRLGSIMLTIAPQTPGPILHWHRMHDETFLVTRGTVRFTSSNSEHVDAQTGDYIIVPVQAIHTFSNPFSEEAEFFNTFTPAYYVDYLRLLCKKAKEAGDGGRKLSEEEQRDIMAQFATFPPGEGGGF